MLTESLDELLDSVEDFGGQEFTNEVIVDSKYYWISRTLDDGVKNGSTFWLVYWENEENMIMTEQPHASVHKIPKVPYIRRKR